MAVITEGFSVNAYIVIDQYNSVNVLGDIKLPRTNTTEENVSTAGTVLLNSNDVNQYIGDIKRSNTGIQGFTIKAITTLDDGDNNSICADVAHSRSVISDQSKDLLASVVLDIIQTSQYIADIRRANSGTQGFTVKSLLSIGSYENIDNLADIAHARCIINDCESELNASLILDVPEDSEILADIRRANSGTQGFTLKAFSMLDNFDENSEIADIYRSVKGLSRSTTKVIYYKGKKYLLYQADKLHYILSGLGDGN